MSIHSNIDTGNDYHNPLDTFTDREEILGLFQRALHSVQSGQLHLLAVKGNSGTGKTFLISYLIHRICPQFHWQSGLISFAQSRPDFRTILLRLEDALKGCVPLASLKQYRIERNEYNHRFDEYKATISIGTIQLHMEARDQSSISNSSQSIQINAQLRERELQLRSELSRALVELSEESEYPLCLFIDGYERFVETVPELVGWLLEDVLSGLARALPRPLLVMTCGWEWPSNATFEPFTKVELTDFNLEQVKGYLEKQEVIASSTDPAKTAPEELIPVFYELTKGHPLVLDLAKTYFKQLGSHERNANTLRANIQLVDDRARVEFLEKRLLERLPEPYRTCLEGGPVLRFFNQATLQALLSIPIDGAPADVSMLTDRSYERFLQYPFVNRESNLDNNSSMIQPTFHELVRRVRLEALRHHHPHTKEQLHRKMADYYKGIVEVESASKDERAQWLAEIPEKEFSAQLEYLYHALQVKELQADAFEEWVELIAQARNGWRRRQAGLLLELMEQLIKEDEPYLSKTNEPYGHYLLWSSYILEQEFRWEEALTVWETAAQVFEQVGNLAVLAAVLNNIGEIYREQGEYKQALRYHERTLTLREQIGDPTLIGGSLNNIGLIYQGQGKLEEALSSYVLALDLSGQIGESAAPILNNIGEIYRQQGEYEQALRYHEQALTLREQMGNPADIGGSLNNIGLIYQGQGKLEEALSNYERALALIERVGDLRSIATVCKNIGFGYQELGNFEQALHYYERTLAFSEQVRDPTAIATILNNIGRIYLRKVEGEQNLSYVEQALHCYERALALSEQVGDPAAIVTALDNISLIYRSQGKYKQALPYYERSLAVFEQVGNLRGIALQCNNIGRTYQKLGKFEQALPYYERTLALSEHVGDLVAITLNNLSEMIQQLGKFEQASHYYERILTLLESVDDPAAIATALNDIGRIYQKLGKFEQAIEYFDRVLVLYERLGSGFEVDTANALEMLATCYNKLGEQEKSSAYQKRALYIRNPQS